MAKKNESLIEINAQSFKDMIYIFRGQQVMLDSDLAAIYGYSTGQFNLQVKHNSDKFEEDFMFQLTDEETNSLRLKISTSNEKSPLSLKNSTSNQRGGRRYNPYVFTEQGIYMLMTVLRGDLATQQSKALIRTFKQMKDFIVDNQSLIGQRDYLRLSLQTTENTRDLLEVRSSLSALDDKVASIVSTLGEVVTKSQLADVMLDFGDPIVKQGWLILNGQPVESDLAYKQIYAQAKHSIIAIDNYINLKTLSLMTDIPDTVPITIISDNNRGMLHLSEFNDLLQEYPHLNITLKVGAGKFHDRYIILDHNTPDEVIYHCGASSKDGGKRIMSIEPVKDMSLYISMIDSTLLNPPLVLH